MVYRVRKQWVEEGLEAVLSRKQRAMPAVPLIFDGEKEAKLIALACSKPPKGSRPRKPGGWSSASNGTTRQNTVAGSIWPSPNLAFYRLNASIAASPTNKPSSRKLPPGSTTEMQTTPRPIGTSQPPTHASNSNTCTRQSD